MIRGLKLGLRLEVLYFVNFSDMSPLTCHFFFFLSLFSLWGSRHPETMVLNILTLVGIISCNIRKFDICKRIISHFSFFPLLSLIFY